MTAKVLTVLVALALAGPRLQVNRNELNGRVYPSAKELKAAKEARARRQAYLQQQNQWVDSVLQTMTEDQKIGHLFMVQAYSNRDEAHAAQIDKLVTEYHAGGVIFFQGGPLRQAQLTNRWQARAKVPLLIGSDCEWGLGMRLDSTLSFPRAMVLGAIADDRLIHQMGREVARQFRRLGMHVNFAPVADVNVNEANPVIGSRSFGQDPENVARHAIAYTQGMQQGGILACAKHFPGHGDTDTDSHFALPVIAKNRARLDSVELYPFRRLVADSLMAVMVSHLHVPALDSLGKQPATYSAPIITELLTRRMRFEGLIFTDALNMRGATLGRQPGEPELLTHLAGSDVFVCPTDVPRAFALIKKAMADGRTSLPEIERRVRKILAAKYFAGLHRYQPVELKNLHQDLNPPQAKALRTKLYEQATTIVRNQGNLLPFLILEKQKFASLVIGAGAGNNFQKMLGKYAPFAHHALPADDPSVASLEAMRKKLAGHSAVVVGLLNVSGLGNKRAADYGIGQPLRDFLQKLQAETKVVVVSFGHPYAVGRLDFAHHLVCAYENRPETQNAVPQVLFGAVAARARLPVGAGRVRVGEGHSLGALGRLRYNELPEALGFDSRVLDRIDTIAQRAIQMRATPGCQVLVARRGQVVFSRNYGNFTYHQQIPVEDETLYDLASLTKVAATMQAVMYLHDRGKLDIEKKMGDYLPDLAGTNKADIVIKDALLHQAGLIQGQPFWWRTMEKGQYLPAYYSRTQRDSFDTPVAENLYATSNMKALVWEWTKANPMRKNKRADGSYGYLYSDLGFYMLKQIVEQQTGQSIDQFVSQYFYRPLGLSTLTYLPLRKFAKEQIAPTEEDRHFRKGVVQGTVHDPDAGLQGGVAGHAGLFGNANDLAILLQMNLQRGRYGGRIFYADTATVPFFTEERPARPNRRGLGWDKPALNATGNNAPSSPLCSDRAFGHTGFTGTGLWVDPEYDLIYVFLANRTYPSAMNWKLKEANIRNLVHTTVYQALGVTGRRVVQESGAAEEGE
jgi:beta-N-acetylhexosaminidase